MANSQKRRTRIAGDSHRQCENELASQGTGGVEYGWLSPRLWAECSLLLAIIAVSVLLLVATSHAAVRP